MDEDLIDALAAVIRKIPYLPIVDRLHSMRPTVTDAEIYTEWSKEQARAVLDTLSKKGLLNGVTVSEPNSLLSRVNSRPTSRGEEFTVNSK